MDDNLKDNFESDEEYEDFKNSYDDYKNRTGMFDSDFDRRALKIILDIESLVHENFHIKSNSYFRIPDSIFGAQHMSLYMYHLTSDKLIYYDEIISMFMN